MKSKILLFLVTAACVSQVFAAAPANTSKLAPPGPDGKLVYAAYTDLGDTLIDFSNCGYGGGGVRIPAVAVRITLRPDPQSEDDTARIQKAVDELAGLPLDPDGFRGALLLAKGTYRISGTILIKASGIVLRGEGSNKDGTVLNALGTGRRCLITVKGSGKIAIDRGSKQKITSNYVPVGARSFEVENGSALKAGDQLMVTRIGNAEWIQFIGMDRIAGRPGNEASTRQWSPFNIEYERTVVAVEGNRVSIDAPITCAIDARWGGGEVAKFSDEGRIQQVGVENLRGESEFNPTITEKYKDGMIYAADERHATYLVGFESVKNAWASDLVAVHFNHGVSTILPTAKFVTVQDSASLDPVSKIDGGRRYPFNIDGSLNLVQRCRSEGARHAFVFGAKVPGPNAFVENISEREYATSEPHHRWSCGGLFDQVHAAIAFQDRQWMGSGHGWAGANYVAWNCVGTLVCQEPPTAQNFAIGHVGEKQRGAFARPDGYWESFGNPVVPKSLYRKQLEDRLGAQAVANIER